MATIRAEQVDAMEPGACAQCHPAVPVKPPTTAAAGTGTATSSAPAAGEAPTAATGNGSVGSSTSPAALPPGNPIVVVSHDKPGWLLIELKDELGTLAVGEPYRVTLPDGSVVEGALDNQGAVRIEGVDDGKCKVSFPQRDAAGWRSA